MKQSKTKILSFLLAVLMLISALPVQTFSATQSAKVQILHNGESVTELLLPEDGQELLEIKTVLKGDLTYQWQILADAENYTWVDINDMTASSCNVTYALVGSLLDAVGKTELRCTVFDGEEKYISDSVSVLVSYNAAGAAQAQEHSVAENSGGATTFA